jgi:hypothetical protein
MSDRIQSLNRALTFLHSPHTPAILRTAIPAATNLIERTTQPGSEQRFTQLCALLGDGVIGSVWMYSSEDADAVEASVGVLPILVRALGIGATRYLKVRFSTFSGRLEDDRMSGVDSSAHVPTSCGSLQEAASNSPVVFPSCIGNSHTRMQPSYRELEEHDRRGCGKMLGRAFGRRTDR